jgi:hypothetical protein
MKRIALATIAWALLACLPSALEAHGRGHGHGGWGFSLHVAPPAPCYHHSPPPCVYPAPYVGHYHVPRPYYPPPRFGFWYGF